MPTMQDLLMREADGGAQFRADLREAFSTGPGRRALAMLIELAHPLRSPLRATDAETHVAIGRKEVVTLLWENAPEQEFNPHNTNGKTE